MARDRIRWIYGLVVVVAIGGSIAYFARTSDDEIIPPEIAGDPLLVRGREIYLLRCVACHGPSAKADGPLSKSFSPRPRNLADGPWKYGEQPDQVLKVIAEGVKEAQMPGWGGTYPPSDLKAVAAYLYQNTGKTVPDSLRNSPAL